LHFGVLLFYLEYSLLPSAPYPSPVKSFIEIPFPKNCQSIIIRNPKNLNMLRPVLFAAILAATFTFCNAFRERSKNSVTGEGIASGDIPFAIRAAPNNGSNHIRYGDVIAPVQSVSISPNGKMATIYFTYKDAVLGVTVINGKKREADQISDPFPADEGQLGLVLPQLSYNTVISGSIEMK
jgi:hypothetical protein